MRSNNMVKINGEKLRAAVVETGFAITNVASMVCGKEKTYLTNAFQKNSIDRGALENLCKFFGMDIQEFVIIDEPKPKKTADAPVAVTKVDMSGVEKKLDTLISSVDALTKAVDTLVAMNAQSYKKLQVIEPAVLQVTKHTAATVEELKIDLDSIDTGIGRVNSNLVTIKGRIDDMMGVNVDPDKRPIKAVK